MAKGPTKMMWKRMASIMLVMVVLGLGTASVRLVSIMLVNGGTYSKLAADQQLSSTTIAAKRGTIYDRNKNVLATSADVWTVYVTPKDIETDEESEIIAEGLSEILELDKEAVLKQIKKNTAYEKIMRKVEQPVADEVRAFISKNKLGSIVGLDVATKRYYPNNNLASTVLGFVGDDNQGLSGVEYQYNEELEGVPGKVVASKNARGSAMPFNYETMVEAQEGNSLILTVDEYIQHFAEKYLEEAVETNNCTNRGCSIIINVNTGEILAMATKPDFDPNEPFVLYNTAAQREVDALQDEERSKARSTALQEQWRNKAVSDTYEPGSVFKTFTGSAAIEENKVNPSSTFFCPGYTVVSGVRYNCHVTTGHNSQSLAKIFHNSCNPAFIEISQRLGSTLFFKYFKAFGFTRLTGIDLPGEAMGIYYTADKMGPVELASESFGQTFRITPIQLITAACAVANGGYYVKPHVVKQVIDSKGNIVKNVEPIRERQVVSESTSRLMCELLEGVVSNGTGKNAYVAGYRVAGKTGTSQKMDKKDSSGNVKERIASFCGYAPADNPQIAVIVILDEPHAPVIYGGTIAAPVAGEILSEALPYLGVEPKYTEEEQAKLDVKTPNLVGNAVEKAKNTLHNSQLKARVVGDGDSVVRQIPAASQTIPGGGTVVLYTEENASRQTVTVPDFNGMTLSQVNATASNAGINVKMAGILKNSVGAAAYKQSVEKGKQIERGTIVQVDFRYQDNVE